MLESEFLRETLRKIKSDARCRRNLEFTIDLNYLLTLLKDQQGRCALSGWPLEFTRGGSFKGGKNPRGCTIDRIDNSQGYVPGNIQLTCCLPNYLKSDMVLADFLALCKDITDFSNRGLTINQSDHIMST
jgi:hypothetical protein